MISTIVLLLYSALDVVKNRLFAAEREVHGLGVGKGHVADVDPAVPSVWLLVWKD